MPAPQDMTNDQLADDVLLFVNDVLATIDVAPVAALNPGFVNAGGGCVLALTLNLAIGVLPARYSTYQAHVNLSTKGDPEVESQEFLTDYNKQAFRVGDDGLVRKGSGVLAKFWKTTPSVDEFLNRFDAGKIPSLIIGDRLSLT